MGYYAINPAMSMKNQSPLGNREGFVYSAARFKPLSFWTPAHFYFPISITNFHFPLTILRSAPISRKPSFGSV